MSERYKAVGGNPFFVTMTIVGWVDLFTRNQYREIIETNLKYCIEHKGLLLHEYVIMPSHIHLIVQSDEGKLPSIIRDFKSYTAKQMIKMINETGESRREWMLKLFTHFAKQTKQNKHYMVWQKTNKSIELHHPTIYEQKKNYIHTNPVNDGFVYRAEDYVFSSANEENNLQPYLHTRETRA